MKVSLCAFVFVFCGCSAALDLAVTGAGKSATIENIKFFTNTSNLKKASRSGLPDYYYISQNYMASKYKVVVINDFTSMTNDVSDISGIQVPAFKNIRADIPDNLAQSFDGSIFSRCIRSSKRIDHRDMNEIKKSSGDAILFGNISTLKSGLRAEDGHVGLTSAQLEIKVVDRKTGEEIIQVVMRNTTDGDKVLMPIMRQMSNLMKIAEAEKVNVQKVNDIKSQKAPPSNSETIDTNSGVQYVIVTKNTSIRARADGRSKVISKISVGEKFKVIGDTDKWYRIETKDGSSGWVLKSRVK